MLEGDRKTKILETAAELLRAKGPTSVNAALVAKKLKMRPSNIFYYFKTQRDLLNGVVLHIVMQNQSIVESIFSGAVLSTAKSKVLFHCKGNLTWSGQKKHHTATLLYGLSEMNNEPFLGNLITKALTAGEDKIYQMLAIGVAEKEIHLRRDIRLTARAIHQMLIGCIVNQYMNEKTPIEEYMERIEDVFDSSLKT